MDYGGSVLVMGYDRAARGCDKRSNTIADVVVLARAKFASLAQLVEHSLDKGKVVGSGPTRSIGNARIAQR